MREMIPPEEAQSMLFDLARPSETTALPLKGALGYVSSGDVHSAYDIPPFTNSAMDGYAVLSADLSGVADDKPARLKVIETVAAGGIPAREVVPGSCIRIMTGAIMPAGADSVVMVERTRREGDDVLILDAVSPGTNVREAGEDLSIGDVVVKEGDELNPARIGLLAATGVPRVLVYRKPKVAVVITGDELIDPGSLLAPGKIFNSNGYILLSMIREAGAVPVEFGIVRDDVAELRTAFTEAFSSCDVVISSGGVSAGEFDYVEGAVQETGGEFLFSSIRQKPGKPMVAARAGSTFFFGLPGNPVSVMVCFELYVRPFLRKMMGFSPFLRRWVKGSFIASYNHTGSRTEWVRVKVGGGEGKYVLDPFHYQGSGVISSMEYADALAKVPADARVVDPDDILDVYMLR